MQVLRLPSLRQAQVRRSRMTVIEGKEDRMRAKGWKKRCGSWTRWRWRSMWRGAWPSTLREMQRVVADGASGGGDSGGGSGSADRRGGARDIPGGVHRGAGVISLRTLRRAAGVAGVRAGVRTGGEGGTLKAMAEAIEAGKRRSGPRHGRASCRRPRTSDGMRRSSAGGHMRRSGWRGNGGSIGNKGAEYANGAAEDEEPVPEINSGRFRCERRLRR